MPGTGTTLTLRLTKPARAQASALRRTASVTTRALRMDSGAMARFVQVGDDMVDVILSTPLGCVVAERIHAVPATEAQDDSVILADALPGILAVAVDDGAGEAGEAGEDAVLELGGTVDLLWTGTAPPAGGYTVVDTVPGADVRELFAGMQREADEHSGPAGLPPSLLDQPLLKLTGRHATGIVEIPGRVVAALGALGLVVEPPREEMRVHDMIRVSVTGSWIRVDALFGTAYMPRPGGLARIPSPN